MALHHLVKYSELVASLRRALSSGAARKKENDKIREKRTAPHLTERLEDATELLKHLCMHVVVYNIMYYFILVQMKFTDLNALPRRTSVFRLK